MPSQSLKYMALHLAKKNIKDIEDLGEMPYELCAPILDAVTDPAHLLRLQEKSPHLSQHTAPKWTEFILRDIPSWSRQKVYPNKPELWCEIYRLCKQRAEEAALAALAEETAAINAKRTEQRIAFAPKLLVPVLYEKSFKKAVIKQPVAKKPQRSAAMTNIMKGIAKHRAELGPRFAPKPIAPVGPKKHTGLAAVKADEVARLTKAAFDEFDAECKNSKPSTTSTTSPQASSVRKVAQRKLPKLQTNLGPQATTAVSQKNQQHKLLKPRISPATSATSQTPSEQSDDPLNFWKSPVKTSPRRVYKEPEPFTFKSFYAARALEQQAARAQQASPVCRTSSPEKLSSSSVGSVASPRALEPKAAKAQQASPNCRSPSPEKLASSSVGSVASAVAPSAGSAVTSLKRPAATITRGAKRTKFF